MPGGGSGVGEGRGGVSSRRQRVKADYFYQRTLELHTRVLRSRKEYISTCTLSLPFEAPLSSEHQTMHRLNKSKSFILLQG